MREWRNDFYATGAAETDGLVRLLAEEVAAYTAKTLHSEPAKSTVLAYEKEISSMLNDGFLTLEQVSGTWNFSTEHLPTAEFSAQQQAVAFTSDRAELLAGMPAENVQEYMYRHNFTFEEIEAEFIRRAAAVTGEETVQAAQFEAGNIAAGKSVEKLAAEGKLQDSVYGYFYGEVEPRNMRRLVKVSGYYRANGNLHVTFFALDGKDFSAAANGKFAIYADQCDAARVFTERAAQAKTAMAAKDYTAAKALQYV